MPVKTIENVENWDQYTLEAPICEINLTASGEDITIKVGEETALGGERYVSIGDENAYLVDSSFLEPFEYGLYDVLKVEEIPDMEEPLRLEVQSGSDQYTIEKQEDSGLAYADDYVWFLGGKPLDTSLTQTLLDYVTDIEWSECVNYKATDLSKYGLDAPAATLTLTYTNEESESEQTFVLEIGSEASSGYYVRLAGSQMVYTIPASAAEAMLYTTYEDLKPTDVLLMDWTEVTSVEIQLDGESYTIYRTTQTETDEDGNETETVVYTLNGEEIDGAAITDLLDGLESTGYAGTAVPETGEEIRFVIHRNHASFPQVEIAFYRYNSSDCLTVLNGEPTVYVSREDIVDLVEYFRQEEEPVVLLFYGDHNPWLGDGNSVYEALGLNLDLSTEEGFYNYYSTRYLFWANDAAKACLGQDFQGEGPTISPNYLMTLLFDLCGWEGSAYLQVTREVMAQIPVSNTATGLYVEDGTLTDQLSPEGEDLMTRFRQLQYYYRKNFFYG